MSTHIEEEAETSTASGSLTVTAALDKLDSVISMITDELKKRACPTSVLNQVSIALEELFVNVCNYAYASKGEPGTCKVSFSFPTPYVLVVELVDEGIPFNPLTREDPTRPGSIMDARIGGLGIFMAKKSVDDITYRHEDGRNILTFKKVWRGSPLAKDRAQNTDE